MSKKFKSGVLRILNQKADKSYYLACYDLNKSVIIQKELLDSGKHKNPLLQHDYFLQEGIGFIFEIIEKEIDFKTAKEIEEIWIESDKFSYNHSNLGRLSKNRP